MGNIREAIFRDAEGFGRLDTERRLKKGETLKHTISLFLKIIMASNRRSVGGVGNGRDVFFNFVITCLR